MDIVGSKNESISSYIFHYTDAFSVFDYGRMPDELTHKGAALAVMSAHFFEKLQASETWREFSTSDEARELRKSAAQIGKDKTSLKDRPPLGADSGESLAVIFNEMGESLQKNALKTHYLGLLDDSVLNPNSASRSISLSRLGDLHSPTRAMVVRKVNVQRPVSRSVMGRVVEDYATTRATPLPKLIPLEVVFRYSCPPGSSLIDKIQKDPSYLSTLIGPREVTRDGVQPGAKWYFPIVELFTKLESTDRRLTLTEALAISGLSSQELQELVLKTVWVSCYLKWAFRQVGVELADGKLEWGLNEQNELILVDGIGPDELRLLKDGVQLSKEFLRRFYRGTTWYTAVNQAKERAETEGTSQWKNLIGQEVPALPKDQKELGSQVYMGLANIITGKTFFKDAWSLNRITEALKTFA